MAGKAPKDSLEEVMERMQKRFNLVDEALISPQSAEASSTPNAPAIHRTSPSASPYRTPRSTTWLSTPPADDRQPPTLQMEQKSRQTASPSPRAATPAPSIPTLRDPGWYFWSDADRQEAHRRASKDKSLPYPPTAANIWAARTADMRQLVPADQARTAGIRIYFYSDGGVKQEQFVQVEGQAGWHAKEEDEVSFPRRQMTVEDFGSAEEDDEYWRLNNAYT